MELEKTKSALDLCIALEKRTQQNHGELFALLVDFNNVYEIESEKLPYHINLIDELHADENSHSRIFAKLLRYKKNCRFLFLESFLHDVCGFEMNVLHPRVEKVDSCGRIDIPIFDTNYVVLIENKVTDKAPDQNTIAGGQLARYIETVKNSYKRNEEDIFVIYTPKYSREPSDDCWINKDGLSYKDSFKLRFKSISYRDDIYYWLKEKSLGFKDNDIYLQSAITQYIDHLEGLFSLRTINKTMNMKLHDFLKEQLNLQDDNPYEAIEILSQKENELNNAMAQIQLLKVDYRRKIVFEKFKEWKEQLKLDFRDLRIVEDDHTTRNELINFGVVITVEEKKFSILMECDIREKINLYFGISPTYTGSDKFEIPHSLQAILNNNGLGQPERYWYGWRHTLLSNGYDDLKDLIKQICAVA